MKYLTTIDRHAGLVREMTRTVGVDMGEALIDGKLSAEEIRSAVIRCTSCDSADICEHWLADKDEASVAEAPEYCRNRDLLHRLRR